MPDCELNVAIGKSQKCEKFDLGNNNDIRLSAFYHATLCQRGMYAVVIHLSVHPSQAGTVQKWLNLGSSKQRHTIAQGL